MPTVGELIQQLSLFDPDAEVFFGAEEGVLNYYRMKGRSEMVQIEFNEVITATEMGGNVAIFAERFPNQEPPTMTLGEYMNNVDDYMDDRLNAVSGDERVAAVREFALHVAKAYYHAAPELATAAVWASGS